jgi:hypothetical protein
MNITLPIPDDIAQRLGADGRDVARDVLEAFAAAEYRAGGLTTAELRRLLGFGTRARVDEFLKARGVYEKMTAADLECDKEDLDRLGV